MANGECLAPCRQETRAQRRTSFVRKNTMSSELHHKIVNLDELRSTVEQARSAGMTIVHCHGCFDVVHPGHLRYLQFARRQGDLLMVSLTGDAAIDKGEQRPYVPQELRAENLAALEFVDLVYIDPNPTAATVLETVRPDIYVKGAEYEHNTDPRFLQERRAVESYGGKVIFSSGEVVFSSSKIIESMPRLAELEEHRVQLVCRRHQIDRVSLEPLIDAFAGCRVLIVGDAVLDRYVFCDATDVANESPMMSLAKLDERAYFSAAAIVTRHLAALGAEVFLLSACGHDDASARLRQTLTDEAVSFRLLPSRPALPERTRFLVDETKLFRVEAAQACPLDSVVEREAGRVLLDRAGSADAVIFCDWGYGMITGGLLDRALPELQKRPCIVAADIGGTRGDILQFKGAHLLCPSERSLRAAMHDFDQGLSMVTWNLLHRTGARCALVTLGKKGLVAFERPSQDRGSADWHGRLRSEHLPSFGDHPVDRLGCGDAVLGVTALAMTVGASPMQAAYLGNTAAAIELSRLGNIPIDADTLRRWLATRPELSVEEVKDRGQAAVGRTCRRLPAPVGPP